ncbi:MAG: class I SAM-dependent methyltransferase, partial [Desulfobacterales bacterium]|nr:class I SAM-dependent methyltransferase [Desulfobacterales bacterium]
MIDLKLFNELFKDRPSQRKEEWLAYLEICELYLKKHAIKKPMVVEIGVYKNKQKKFYEQLLGAEHIGIDISDRRSVPDIKGDTRNPETLTRLKEKLAGRNINILFIDGCHQYDDVRKDFKAFSPLCTDIVAFHDTEIGRRGGRDGHQAWVLWDQLKDDAYYNDKGLHFLSIQHG